jgi:D-alanine--poly(phosphoribitol) ligase subunit 1
MRFDFHKLVFTEETILPEKLVIAGSDGDLSWRELKGRSDALCRKLQSLEIPFGSPVIIYGQKEILFPVAILSCLRLGIPYVPVDRIMPQERLRKIRETTGAQILIAPGNRETDPDFPIIVQKDLTIKRNKIPEWKTIPSGKTDPVVYIMFTSGSTGEPKGVMITLKAVRSCLDWFVRDFPVNRETVFMNQATFSFDISLYDALGTFSLGATMVLNDTAITHQPQLFFERIKRYGCTFWNSTPSFVYPFLTDPGFTKENFSALKTFLFLGEDLPVRTVRKLHEVFPGVPVYNSYGPTEATVSTTLIEITPEIADKYEKNLPIGYPKPDGEVYIENEEEGQGEIVIAGDHVSVGYLNRSDLNEEKFLEHKGMRAYRTGDYGYIKDGLLFCAGRKDDQVKMNGYRIELGEISGVLLKQPGVNDAITIALKSQGKVKKIVSFVKTTDGADPEDIKKMLYKALEKQLPEYMVPGDISVLTEFPVSASYKVDKLKLTDFYLKSL